MGSFETSKSNNIKTEQKKTLHIKQKYQQENTHKSIKMIKQIKIMKGIKAENSICLR